MDRLQHMQIHAIYSHVWLSYYKLQGTHRISSSIQMLFVSEFAHYMSTTTVIQIIPKNWFVLNSTSTVLRVFILALFTV